MLLQPIFRYTSKHMARLDVVREARLEKLRKLKELGVNSYPAAYERTHTTKESQESLNKSVKTAGRLWALREHGASVFANLKDETGQIQIWFQKEKLGEDFELISLLDVGDFLGIEGEVVETKTGEITIDANKFTLLTKSLRPIPPSWHGLKDTEERYRKRYLDLLLDPEVKNRFDKRAKLIKETRKYLDDKGFIELETPTLQPLYGGANAKPFKTRVNVLDQEFYLRIADELYLKRLVIGGYEKVFEICKDFRNEGLDLTHQPEFTMMEFYEAFADYNTIMERTEGLFKHLAQEVLGKTTLEVGDHKIDIGNKWRRIEMSEIIKETLRLDIEEETEESLKNYCEENNIELVGGEAKGQLIFTIFEHKITDNLIEPTWVIDYPKEVSPLSKDHRSKPGWVERFEGYIGGKEICDGWSELTNPIEQRARFEEDIKAARKDREEAQQVDEDFLEAMEYGMPPLGGIGIGIDRLSMFFTNTWSIKEVVLFPLMRRTGKEKESGAQKQTPKTATKKQPVGITREEAHLLLIEMVQNKNLIKHGLAVEAIMRALAGKFGEDEEEWGIVGLLHDADYEVTDKDPKKHTLVISEKLREIGVSEKIINAIQAHSDEIKPNRENLLEKAVYAADELSGLITAVALVRPDKKLSAVTVDSVMKKFPNKSFAKGAKREQIETCEKELGIPLTDFVALALVAMQGISNELGL